MEDVAQKITKFLYGDDYDNSKYENILTYLHDFEKLAESFNELITDLIEYHKPVRDDE